MDEKYASLKTADDLSILNGRAFEDYLKQLFEDLGYTVRKTPGTGDYGADLLLAQNGVTAAVQAKQYVSEVGFDAIKEVHFARTYYNTDEAWVVCTTGFTRQAHDAAQIANVKLIAGDDLKLLMDRRQTACYITADGKRYNPHSMTELIQEFKSKRLHEESRLYGEAENMARESFREETSLVVSVFAGLKWKLVNRPPVENLGSCEFDRQWIIAQFGNVGDGARLFETALEYGLFVPIGDNYAIPLSDDELISIAGYQRQQRG